MSTESKTIAEDLAQRWIKDEQQYRAQVAEARTAGTPHSGMMGHADQLAECRRSLQEAFGLVLSRAEVSKIVAENETEAGKAFIESRKTNAERLKRQGEIFNHDGKCGKIVT